jgi:glycosyltransferase involved in cell wall biosynthesis
VISLVVATRGRTAELSELFASLAEGQGAEFELILVDQNGDARLDPVVAAAPFPIRHLRTDRAHANAARNLGLRHARGTIVAFPDDDCLMPPGTLARVESAFADPALGVLTGPAAAPEGGLGSGRWRAESGAITLENVWTSVIEFNLWIRRDLALALGGFDEAMGPGARFGSAEGNDLVCRAIAAGHAARYDQALRVVHPDKRLTPEAVERAGRYGLGLGFALRRHPVPAATRAQFLVRPAGGAVLSLLRGRTLEARYYLATLRGRAAGMLAAPTPLPAPLEPLP